MAYLPFPQFLNRYGIKLFFSSVADTKPGAVIKRQKRGFFVIGTLDDVLGGGSAKWSSTLQDANFVYGRVDRTLSLKGKASLKEFGVSIDGGLNRATAVTYQITGVKARSFKTQSRIKILPELENLRLTNKAKWKLINNCWIAEYVYYATEFTVKFDAATGVKLKADFENRVKVSGEAELDWKTDRSFTITNNLEVPFGFSGWQV
jgi:hypothetical protein